MTHSSSAGHGLSYKDAGVDIQAGDALVKRIAPLAAATARPGVIGGLGGFGGLFDLKASGYTDPLLVAATDGVGTKLKLAVESGRHDTIGIDLVAMSVNDLVVQGAEPLFFLDYFACGRLEVKTATQIVAGIAEGCRQAGCALIGGESAEMPGVYRGGDYDLAGFALGAVERNRLLPQPNVAAGDIVLGLASDGLHSNGFSLVRKLIAQEGLSLSTPAPFAPEVSLAEALLKPTRLYVKPLLQVLGGPYGEAIKALAHITGGGISENLPRVLPEGLSAAIDLSAIKPPPVFRWMARLGRIGQKHMLETFNCGLGMIVVVTPARAQVITEALTRAGETVTTIGHIETGPPGVRYRGALWSDKP